MEIMTGFQFRVVGTDNTLTGDFWSPTMEIKIGFQFRVVGTENTLHLAAWKSLWSYTTWPINIKKLAGKSKYPSKSGINGQQTDIQVVKTSWDITDRAGN